MCTDLDEKKTVSYVINRLNEFYNKKERMTYFLHQGTEIGYPGKPLGLP